MGHAQAIAAGAGADARMRRTRCACWGEVLIIGGYTHEPFPQALGACEVYRA